MSSLYRNSLLRHALAGAAVGAQLALCLLVQPAAGQEVSFVPFGSASAEWDSNRVLERPPVSAASYGGLVGAEVRDLTPRSYTDLAAQILYTDIPQIGYSWTSGSAALKSDFKTLEAEYTLLAAYRHENDVYTEFGHANFDNDLTLTSPDTNATANVKTGITRDSYEVDPGFDYNFTPRLDMEGDFRLSSVRYSVQTPGQNVDYTSPYAGLTLNYDTSPRSSIGIGPYFSRYQETGGTNTTDTDGAAFTYNYKTSDVTRMSLVVRVERDHIDVLDFPSESTTTWGVEWVGTHKFEVGKATFSIGKFLEPSSIGGRVALDQFRVQYDRPLSERLSFDAALRVTRAELVGAAFSGDVPTEDRTNAELNLRFDITRTWYVTGGYIFARARDLGEGNLAYSNGAVITVGYRGLEPPRPVGH